MRLGESVEISTVKAMWREINNPLDVSVWNKTKKPLWVFLTKSLRNSVEFSVRASIITNIRNEIR
jgi:hypothetical protein